MEKVRLVCSSVVTGAEIVNDLLLCVCCDRVICDAGWTAQLEPADHPAGRIEFDFIVGAEGRRISLEGFRKKCFRAKQALAITFNLENKHSKGDNQVTREFSKMLAENTLQTECSAECLQDRLKDLVLPA